MEQSELMSTSVPPGSFEMNAPIPQYFATGVPEPGHHPAQHEYYAGPPMPPPPLPEPPGTSNVSLDPMLQQPPQPQPQPQLPQNQVHDQGSEAIINAAKAERTAQDRERGRLRVQRFRMKRKLADAEAGRRDKETLKKIKFPSATVQDGSNNGAGPSNPRKAGSAKDTEAEVRERERGRLRVQAYRMRKKLAEAKEGIRDATTLKKIRSIKGETPAPSATPNPVIYPPTMPHLQAPMVQYPPDNMFNVPVEAPAMLPPPPPIHPQAVIPDQTQTQPQPRPQPQPQVQPQVQPVGDASQPPSSPPTTSTTTSPRQRAVRTNWFHPSRWSTINAAGLRANFSSAHEIVRLAKLAPGGEAVRTNWFHPSRWSTINAAGLRANFSSAHEIVRLAKLAPGGEETFKTLDRGTVHKWIDKERGGWSEGVLEKVRKAAVKEAESWDAARAGEGTKMDNIGGFDDPVLPGEVGQDEQAEMMPLTQVMGANP
ncbi:unnamed protein product [Rhizoctonia solani]|uniref:Uncharacterized protein n=1 Tax=Rhizoctonia solani TaxID=456999 RepID=A0A8H3DT32_9AGAM|nr:unnamed protein product [Rhizoctonia solani]